MNKLAIINFVLREAKVTSPFAGGKKTNSITQYHQPLIWENMLGTVYARNSKTEKTKYFDYDYDAAHKFADVANSGDLRIYKWDHSSDSDSPRKGQWVLCGIPSEIARKSPEELKNIKKQISELAKQIYRNFDKIDNIVNEKNLKRTDPEYKRECDSLHKQMVMPLVEERNKLLDSIGIK